MFLIMFSDHIHTMSSVKRPSGPGPGPGTLYNACLQFIISNIEETIASCKSDDDKYILHEEVSLPQMLCEQLLQACPQSGHVIDDKFMNLFRDPVNTRLKRVHVQDSYISDESLEFIMKHEPVELNVSGCLSLTSKAVNLINEGGKKLVALLLGKAAPNILSKLIVQNDSHCAKGDEKGVCIFDCPTLRAMSVNKLTVDHKIDDQLVSRFFGVLFRPLKMLNYLDINYCDVGDFDFLEHLPHLTTLIMHDVTLYDLRGAFEAIKELQNLR